MTERLTEKIDGGYQLKIPKDTELSDLEIKFAVYDKLGAYEDAEDQGLLHRAQIPNGTTIYIPFENSEFEVLILTESYLYNVSEYSFGELGKDFYLTREEAEAALTKENTTETPAFFVEDPER